MVGGLAARRTALGHAQREGRIRHARGAEMQIETRSPPRHQQHQRHSQHRAAARGDGSLRRRAGGGQQAPLDLQTRRLRLGLTDQAAGDVALQLLQLVAIDGGVVAGAVRQGTPGPQHWQHEHQPDRQRHAGKNRNDGDHASGSLSNCATRARSASVSGGGAAGRRRRASASPAPPASSTKAGPNHSSSVAASSGGFSSTKSP